MNRFRYVTLLCLFIVGVVVPVYSHAQQPYLDRLVPNYGAIPKVVDVFLTFEGRSDLTSVRDTYLFAQGAQEPETNAAASRHSNISSVIENNSVPTAIGTLALGAGYWPDLHNVETDFASAPGVAGHPRAWGPNVELAFHVNVYEGNRWNLFLGGDLGFLFFRNTKTFNVTEIRSGDNEKARLISTLIHITPSLKLIGNFKHLRPFLGGGLGLYSYSLSVVLEDELFGDIRDEVDEVAFGGYVSLGVDIPFNKTGKGVRVRIEDQVHLFDFGKIQNDVFSSGSGGLTGPINVIQLGIAYGF